MAVLQHRRIDAFMDLPGSCLSFKLEQDRLAGWLAGNTWVQTGSFVARRAARAAAVGCVFLVLHMCLPTAVLVRTALCFDQYDCEDDVQFTPIRPLSRQSRRVTCPATSSCQSDITPANQSTSVFL
eukprot:366413-Chlamydomonas_euryale.AAC.18